MQRTLPSTGQAVAPTLQPPHNPQAPCRGVGVGNKTTVTGAQGSPAPAVPPALHPAVAPGPHPALPATEGQGEGWVPARRAAGHQRGPWALSWPQGCSEMFLSVPAPQQGVLRCCPRCHP